MKREKSADAPSEHEARAVQRENDKALRTRIVQLEQERDKAVADALAAANAHEAEIAAASAAALQEERRRAAEDNATLLEQTEAAQEREVSDLQLQLFHP